MKKRIIITAIIVLFVLSLLPIKYEYKDGGSAEYKSLWYSVTSVHSFKTEQEQKETGREFNVGTRVEILGFEVFDDVK